MARFIARLALEVGEMLFTLSHPLPGVEDLLDWDMGMGVDHAAFVDLVLPVGAPDPPEYAGALALSDQLDLLAIG